MKLNAATGRPDSGAQMLSIARRNDSLAPDGSGFYHAIEGPFLIKHGSWYYLWLSFDRCCNASNSTYNIRVGRSAKLTGPYLDKAGVSTMNNGGTLILAGDSRWKGPGHNAIFIDHDTTFLVNHSYDAQNAGRTTLMIRPLYWDVQGWPTLDPALAVGPYTRNHNRIALQ